MGTNSAVRGKPGLALVFFFLEAQSVIDEGSRSPGVFSSSIPSSMPAAKPPLMLRASVATWTCPPLPPALARSQHFK